MAAAMGYNAALECQPHIHCRLPGLLRSTRHRGEHGRSLAHSARHGRSERVGGAQL
jgi:hypothetical protein